MWLTVINKIFKFSPHLYPFGQENFFHELSSGYLTYPLQKWYIRASFQTSRKAFHQLQDAIWLTAINKIFKFLPQLHPFGQENYYYKPPEAPWITKFKNDTFAQVNF